MIQAQIIILYQDQRVILYQGQRVFENEKFVKGKICQGLRVFKDPQ